MGCILARLGRETKYSEGLEGDVNFMGIGVLLRSLWAFLSTPIGGGSRAQKDQLIEMLQTQNQTYQTFMGNHLAHMQASTEAIASAQKEMVIAQKDTADSLRENTATLKEIRASMEAGNVRLAHIEGRLKI